MIEARTHRSGLFTFWAEATSSKTFEPEWFRMRVKYFTTRHESPPLVVKKPGSKKSADSPFLSGSQIPQMGLSFSWPFPITDLRTHHGPTARFLLLYYETTDPHHVNFEEPVEVTVLEYSVSSYETMWKSYGLRDTAHLWTLILRGGVIYKRTLYFLICLCLERAQLAQRAQGGGVRFPL